MSGNSSDAAILQPILTGAAGLKETTTLFYHPIGGGSINDTYQVSTKDNKRWFCKFNSAALFPGLFVKEANGLALLRRQGLIRVPAVVACTGAGDRQVLVLEWIDQGPESPQGGSMRLRSTGFWRAFGEQLARLHRVTQDSFGLDENNYMGALPQDNRPIASWPEFFIRRRLQPQVRVAFDHGLLEPSALGHFERLYPALPGIFNEEPPSLLHGDLWSGNFLCDQQEQPVLIDPAVYFGHRSMDLAMTTLFGGFESAFYEAYAYHYPLSSNYREQWEIANLYPLLIHLNLFGKRPSSGGPLSPSSPVTFASLGYLGNILHTIQRF